MKKLLKNKAINVVLWLAVIGLAGKLLWDAFEVGTRIRLRNAVNDLVAGRQVVQARQALRELDRGRVLAALKGALEDEGGTVLGKVEVVNTLNAWREVRAARRALHSNVPSTRRAAAWLFHSDESRKAEIGEIVVDWIRDEGAEGRYLAAKLVGRLRIEECVPDLMKGLERPQAGLEEVKFAQDALTSLAEFQAEGLADRAMAIAQDTQWDVQVRGRAFDVVARMKEIPRDEVQALMLKIVGNPRGNNILRNQAAGVLRRKEFGNEVVWKALEETIVAKGDDGVVQRSCLYALGGTAPLDRLRKILLDRNVYEHPYFGIRVDVASALAVLQVKERIALEVLCDFLVDEDPHDSLRLVRQEGWLSFWALSGLAYGVREKQLFQNPPKAITSDEVKRAYLWSIGSSRIAHTTAMIDALKEITGDLAEMKKIRQVYLDKLDWVVAKWEKEAAPPPEEEPEKKDEPEDAGPQPPPPPPDQPPPPPPDKDE